MRAAVVAVGTELLMGASADTNTAVIAARLGDLGFDVDHAACVPDDVAAIADAVAYAVRKRAAVCVTGGLGPTFDDVTREGIARALRLDIERDETQEALLRARYAQMDREVPDFALRQADRLSSATFLAVSTGTAPGQLLEARGTLVALMPGVPSEMVAMLEEELLPRLRERFSLADRRRRRRLRATGLSESDVQVRIADVRDRHPDVRFGVLAYPEEIHVLLSERSERSRGPSVDRVAAEVEEALGDVVFGKNEQTLEATVVGLLASADMTLATAESCTGGLVAMRLTEVPGASAVFKGGVVAYSDEAKRDWLSVSGQALEEYGAVSSPVVTQMAANVRLSRRSTYGLAVTGIAGPAGATPDKPVGLVYLALADGDEVTSIRRVFAGTRAEIRRRASQVGLDMVRRAVSAHISGSGRT